MKSPALIAAALLAAPALAAPTPARVAPAAPPNAWQCGPRDLPELCSLAAEDQKDRTAPVDWARVTPRDRVRRGTVLALLKVLEPRTSGDYFHAALVMQHGETWEDYAVAHLLSTRALQLAPADPNAQRMVAASWDRMMHSLGKKQFFGTNTFTGPDGKVEPKETRPDLLPKSLIDLWSSPWVMPE